MTPHRGFAQSDDAEKGPTCQQGIYVPAIAKIDALEDRSHRHCLFRRDCGFLSVHSASTCDWDAGYGVREVRDFSLNTFEKPDRKRLASGHDLILASKRAASFLDHVPVPVPLSYGTNGAMEWLKETPRVTGQDGTAPRTPECEPFPRRKEEGVGQPGAGRARRVGPLDPAAEHVTDPVGGARGRRWRTPVATTGIRNTQYAGIAKNIDGDAEKSPRRRRAEGGASHMAMGKPVAPSLAGRSGEESTTV
ncbi:hypothetical protein BGZ61DRAFT_546480 [Ilyonectria robusta]|uniref:uncharacterized protein n=1 Tax=Ilyonectria robusta TaxID=1079257 RepID=UPI001E8D5430|nr:uncharacterized protein BGZ61DRAFT_546480 [Ilyonectria robusta]KAH8688310.1 hypothetical protein BGZ61DRAFT_546480 [Ilyonectria robusta]